jgi:hypothetical protein
MSMMWDWMIERETDPGQVRHHIGELLGQPICRYAPDEPETGQQPTDVPPSTILCRVHQAPGQFPTVVSCFRAPDESIEWEIAAAFSRAINARCLLSDDTINSSRWLLADPSGQVRPVHVSIDDTGQGEAFYLQHDCSTSHPQCRQSTLCQSSNVPADTVLILPQ